MQIEKLLEQQLGLPGGNNRTHSQLKRHEIHRDSIFVMSRWKIYGGLVENDAVRLPEFSFPKLRGT